MKLAFIGAGNMGGAIARGLYNQGVCKASDIIISDPCQANRDAFTSLSSDFVIAASNSEAAAAADYVVIAVKPWLVQTVCEEIKGAVNPSKQTIISIAAGTNLADIQGYLGGDFSLFRVLPNTAIALGHSMNFISTLGTSKAQDEYVFGLFDKLGRVMAIPEDKMMPFMALSSCGIAYALRYIRAAAEAACEMGIRPDDAHEVVAQTMVGAAQLILQNRSNPEVEIDKVTTPGGWTIKGLNAMEKNGFTNAVIEGIKASK